MCVAVACRATERQHSAVPWFSILQSRGAVERAWVPAGVDYIYGVDNETQWSVYEIADNVKPGFHPNAIACVACVAFGWKPGFSRTICGTQL